LLGATRAQAPHVIAEPSLCVTAKVNLCRLEPIGDDNSRVKASTCSGQQNTETIYPCKNRINEIDIVLITPHLFSGRN